MAFATIAVMSLSSEGLFSMTAAGTYSEAPLEVVDKDALVLWVSVRLNTFYFSFVAI